MRSLPARTRQRGLTMIVIIVLLTLISAYLLASGINRTSGEVSVERDRRTQEVLLQAKAALIAHAASRAWNVTDATDQPGSLPCPDINNDGIADAVPDCTSGASRVGRFPWKTVGAPELRDANGETLWYAVSASFRTRSDTTRVNSDTQGQLTVVGTAPQSNVVALLIAPGAAVQDPLLPGKLQDRSPANVNRVASYLEDKNAGGSDTYTSAAPGANGVYVPAASTYNSLPQSVSFFNDRLVSVTAAELFSVVEPVVAARIERSVKPLLTAYFREWGAFPFPAKFAGPDPGSNSDVAPPVTTRTQDQYVGDPTQTSGLLPITAFSTNAHPYGWTADPGSVTLTGGVANPTVKPDWDCKKDKGEVWKCTFKIIALDSAATCGSATKHYCMVNPSFKVTGNVDANAGKSFARLPSAGDVTVSRTLSSRAISGTLDSAGVGTVIFQGTIGDSYTRFESGSFELGVDVRIPEVLVSVLTSAYPPPGQTEAGFFIRNEWYRQLYYAVSPSYLPGVGGTCTPGSTCLTVNKLPSRYGTANDKQAILLLAGRSLNGSARPSANVVDYLEGGNLTALNPPYAFENRPGTPTAINDRVVVVCPSAATITAASNTSPIIITTSAPHDVRDGADVTISGVAGNTAANGGWTITVTNSTRFILNGSSGNGTYTSGGVLCS